MHADPANKQLFGQPRGLATLFLTEMWERFAYYGMRAILILYAVAALRDGGLGLDDHVASAVYGLYIAATYVFALLGGWIADRLLGAQRAVIIGGVIILFGNALLVLGHASSFFLGLVVIVLGVGLLKPNISVMVAELYPEGGARRDAGFSIFYVGISVGALLGSMLVPQCAERFGWRWGFALPVLGMMLGLGQFMLTRKWLGHRGRAPEKQVSWRAWLPVAAFIAVIAVICALALTGQLTIDPVRLADGSLVGDRAVCAGLLRLSDPLRGLECAGAAAGYIAMGALFAAYAIFYAGFEQGGASLNLFADAIQIAICLAGAAGRRIAGRNRAVHDPICAGFCGVVARLGRRGKDPSAIHQVRGRPGTARRGLSGHVCGRGLRRRGIQSLADLAALHLLPAGVWRSVSLAGRAVLDDQARAADVT